MLCCSRVIKRGTSNEKQIGNSPDECGEMSATVNAGGKEREARAIGIPYSVESELLSSELLPQEDEADHRAGRAQKCSMTPTRWRQKEGASGREGGGTEEEGCGGEEEIRRDE
jgi:hypothetical protein